MSIFRGISRWPAAGAAAAWIERFYFQPAGPAGLALCRMWVYGALLLDCIRFDVSRWADATPALWKPVLLFAWLPGPILTSEMIRAAQGAYMLLLGLCCLGLCFRWASRMAVPLALLVYGLPNCFGKVDHSQTLSVFALAIFALSHAGRVWSADARIARWRGQSPPPLESSEYQWPVRLLQALLSTVFLAAGIAKLRASGLGWITSDHLQNTLLSCYYVGSAPPTRLGLWVAQFPWLCHALAGLTIVIELTAPLALFSRRYRWLVIPSLFGMQLGIYLVMGISFWQYLILYFVWIEWNELAAWIGRRMRPATNPRKGKVPSEPAFD